MLCRLSLLLNEEKSSNHAAGASGNRRFHIGERAGFVDSERETNKARAVVVEIYLDPGAIPLDNTTWFFVIAASCAFACIISR